jgi:hypothetical protein
VDLVDDTTVLAVRYPYASVQKARYARPSAAASTRRHLCGTQVTTVVAGTR